MPYFPHDKGLNDDLHHGQERPLLILNQLSSGEGKRDISLPRQNKIIVLILLSFAIIGLFFSSCSTRKTSIDSQDQESEESDVLPEENPGAPSIFPHLEGWEGAASHGSFVLTYGLTDCLECHKIVSDRQESIPTCVTCHSLYPHSSSWVKKEVHGAVALNFGKQTCATQCHGADFKGGLSGVSCQKCHTTYPHTTDWDLPSNHGLMAKGDGKTLCKSCHGEDLTGGDAHVSCFQCHSQYPHASRWKDSDEHGIFVNQKGKGTCATACHGPDLSGGLSNVSCTTCHTLYPHSAAWSTGHGPTTLQVGKDTCEGCHGTDYKTVLGDKNCFSCHTDYPHPEDTVWLPYNGGHGERVMVTYNENTEKCQGCHGGDLKTEKNGKTCFTCHPSFPHPGTPWEDYEGHGAYVLTTLENNKTSCELCHGDDLMGGISGQSCFECHPGYPHLEGWKTDNGVPQEHGLAAYGDGKNSCASASCHGADFAGNPPSIPGCKSAECHPQFPHTEANWVNGYSSGHMTTFLQLVDNGEPAACTECHGADYDRVMNNTACTQCHQTGEVLHEASWPGGTGHGTYFSNQYNSQSADTYCANCHGNPITFTDTYDSSGGVCLNCHALMFGDVTSDQVVNGELQVPANPGNVATCYDCHWTYPHTDYEGGALIDNPWILDSGGVSDVHTLSNFGDNPENIPGHIFYILRYPLFIDADGNRDSMPTADASEYSCGGGTAATCHFNGFRAQTTNEGSCATYCHNP